MPKMIECPNGCGRQIHAHTRRTHLKFRCAKSPEVQKVAAQAQKAAEHHCRHCARPEVQQALAAIHAHVPYGQVAKQVKRAKSTVREMWEKAIARGCTSPRTCALCPTPLPLKVHLCEACHNTTLGKQWRDSYAMEFRPPPRPCATCRTPFTPSYWAPRERYCGRKCMPSLQSGYRWKRIRKSDWLASQAKAADREKSYDLWFRALGVG